jgi:hypothetical protein
VKSCVGFDVSSMDSIRQTIDKDIACGKLENQCLVSAVHLLQVINKKAW